MMKNPEEINEALINAAETINKLRKTVATQKELIAKLEQRLEGGYYRTTDDGIPVWVDKDGFTHPYTHQDEDYSNLCTSEWCRCKS